METCYKRGGANSASKRARWCVLGAVRGIIGFYDGLFLLLAYSIVPTVCFFLYLLVVCCFV